MEQLRAYLDEIFDALIDSEDIEEKPTLYIQEPGAQAMSYPCILIRRGTGDTKFADNNVHRHQKRYELTAIDRIPDGPWYDILASLPRATHNRTFPADNLTHDVFTMFF